MGAAARGSQLNTQAIPMCARENGSIGPGASSYRVGPPSQVFEALRDVVPPEGQASGDRLLHVFWLERRAYRRPTFRRLLALARGQRADRWEARILATLMLQQQVSCLPPGDIGEHAWILHALGIKGSPGPRGDVDPKVVADGYS